MNGAKICSPPAKDQYWLSKHVYVCGTNDHVVLLDLKRDEYIGISAGDSRALAAYVPGWPLAKADRGATQIDHDVEQVLEQMLSTDVLTLSASEGKSASPVVLDPPSRSLAPDALGQGMSFRDALRFVHSTAIAHLLLRKPPLTRAILHVAAGHSRRNLRFRAGSRVFGEVELAKSVATFMRLRPLLTRSRDRCLFDGLALAEFLTARGVAANWVFGVETNPFAAHCWLQLGDIVLNDTVEHVGRFTPIMVI